MQKPGQIVLDVYKLDCVFMERILGQLKFAKYFYENDKM